MPRYRLRMHRKGTPEPMERWTLTLADDAAAIDWQATHWNNAGAHADRFRSSLYRRGERKAFAVIG